jgi:hypothetical protein|tara:strand:- start:329 stop:709 length:381 start_codon:yes stop_codon:yes gene_type:complete
MYLLFEKDTTTFVTSTDQPFGSDMYDAYEISETEYDSRYNYTLTGDPKVPLKGDLFLTIADDAVEFAAMKIDSLRGERNLKLSESDWMANSDVTMSSDWATYRQALRDITDTYISMDTVVWPTKPE